MAVVLAFDVYGTLIDTLGVVHKLREIVGDNAEDFARIWRDKQLEYSFRRGLMRSYEPFAVCTSQSLDYTSAYFDIELTPAQRLRLLLDYRQLPAFDDVSISLASLRSDGYLLYAFSNGTTTDVEALLSEAGIRNLLDGVISVDDLQTFKPNPDVYEHLLNRVSVNASETWLISSNPFDVIGAVSYGLRSAWVRRSNKTIFDPWGVNPTLTLSSLSELAYGIADL